MKIELKLKKLPDGEYRVGWFEDGKLNDIKSYYTDDIDDANETMREMRKEIDEPEFVPAPEIEIESAYPEVKKIEEIANEIIREYNHGTAEFSDCEGVTGKQYAAVIEDLLLYMNAKLFDENRDHFEGWVKE